MNKFFLFWVSSFFILIALIMLFKSILTPFVAGFILAYLFNPVANKLEKLGMSRNGATLTILLWVIVLIILIIMLIAPIIYNQVSEFVIKFPSYLHYFNQHIIPLISDKVSTLSLTDNETIRETLQEHVADFITWTGKFITGIVSSGLAIYDIISIVIITPVVTYYLIRDWSNLSRKLKNALPLKHKKTINLQIEKVNETLSGFFRGQGMVCLILGSYYGLALSLLGLNFGLFVGFISGILTFIPYVGATIGLIVSLLIAIFQFGLWEMPLLIAGLFTLGQIAEGYFLTPRLVGKKVGLHPVWIIFSLLAGAHLFGFVGILLAVPIAALIGVLCRFLFELYIKSSYYHHKPTAKKYAKKSST